MSWKRKKKSPRALVLGCGPTGLFAAHALALGGWEISIMSRKRRSEMFGAQYLHQPIPGLAGADDPQEVNYVLRGSESEYREKVYGNRPIPFVSPSKLAGRHPAWDIRLAYYDAWSRYSDLIIGAPDINGEAINELISKEYSWDLIVSTIPAPAICVDPSHHFRTQSVWALGDAPERGQFCPVTVQPMTVVCNGERNPGWYRASNVFGYRTAEWPDHTLPPLPGITQIEKPIETNCTCWAEQVMKLGRFGSWSKASFSHQGFYRLHPVAIR